MTLFKNAKVIFEDAIKECSVLTDSGVIIDIADDIPKDLLSILENRDSSSLEELLLEKSLYNKFKKYYGLNDNSLRIVVL